MKTTVRSMRGMTGLLAAGIMLATPALAAAQSAHVVTKQVLPPGGTSCTPLFVHSVTTYVYDGVLNSFDLVLSDPSYVGVFGQAGDAAIPFNYMTRRMEPNGAIRLHVDTTAAITDTLNVTVTLISASSSNATSSQAVCLSTVSFATDTTGTITSAAPVTQPIGDGSGTGVTGGSGASTGSTGNTGGKTGGKSGGVKTGSTGVATTSTSTSATSTGIGGMIEKSCRDNGAYQLWFILLAIYFVIVAFVGLSQPPLLNRHSALPGALIGIPLALLILFWWLVPDCRVNVFIPIIMLVAAAIGLYGAYRTSPLMQPVIQLPAAAAKKEEKKDEKKQ